MTAKLYKIHIELQLFDEKKSGPMMRLKTNEMKLSKVSA